MQENKRKKKPQVQPPIASARQSERSARGEARDFRIRDHVTPPRTTYRRYWENTLKPPASVGKNKHKPSFANTSPWPTRPMTRRPPLLLLAARVFHIRMENYSNVLSANLSIPAVLLRTCCSVVHRALIRVLWRPSFQIGKAS